jgi:hypothetical protein
MWTLITLLKLFPATLDVPCDATPGPSLGACGRGATDSDKPFLQNDNATVFASGCLSLVTYCFSSFFFAYCGYGDTVSLKTEQQ